MPNWTQEIESRLASLRLAAGREAEIIEELSEHLEQRYAELRGEGLDEAAALALVREELRDDPDLTERMRPLRQANVPPPVAVGAPRRELLADLWQDLRLATRMLRKQKALTLMVVLTLAIGVGANGALFALVDRVLLRDLPVPEPDRLGDDLGTDGDDARGPRLAAQSRRLDAAEPIVRRDRRRRPEHRQHGHERRGRRGSGVAPMGHGRNIRGARCAADRRPHVSRRRRCRACQRRRLVGGVLAHALRRRSRHRGPKHSLRRRAVHGRRRGSARSGAARSGEHLGVAGHFKECPTHERGSYWLQTVARLKPGVSLEAARDDLAQDRGGSRARISRDERRPRRGAASRCATSCSAPS